MSVYCVWGKVENTLILHFEGAWTWREFEKAEQNLWKMTAELDQSVIVIADYSNASAFPSRLITEGTKVIKRFNPRVESCILVGKQPVMKLTLTIIKRMFSEDHPLQRFTVAHTLDEAYIMLRETYRNKSLAKND